jgi:SecD/SecF fusion protein
LIIFVGLGAAVARGKNMLDNDFLGGTSVEMLFLEPMTESEVNARLREKFEPQKVDFTAIAITGVQGHPNGTIYKVDSSLGKVEDLQRELMETFRNETGQSLLASNKVQVGSVTQREAPPPGFERPVVQPALSNPMTTPEKASPESSPPEQSPPAKTSPPAETNGATPGNQPPVEAPSPTEKTEAEKKTDEQDEPATTPAAQEKAPNPCGAESLVSTQAQDGAVPGDSAATDATASQNENTQEDPSAAATQAQPAETPANPPAPANAQKSATEPNSPLKPNAAEPAAPTTPANVGAAEAPTTTPVASAVPRVWTKAEVKFTYPVNAPTIMTVLSGVVEKLSEQDLLERKVWHLNTDDPDWIDFREGRNADFEPTSNRKFQDWTLNINASPADVKLIVDELEKKMESDPVWQSSSEIGSKVADNTRYQAIWAVLASFLGIIAYVWVRFHRLAYGLAAVVALIHDVLVAIAFIGISAFVASILGFLLIEEFKISLTVVAALLTLIGYSLNDTIVIFDRIREIKGKSPTLTSEMINRSINETLSRTIINGGLTFSSVLILFLLGGSEIHGFAFAMLIGVIAGIYSTIFIAAPLLLWMAGREKARALEKTKAAQKARVG